MLQPEIIRELSGERKKAIIVRSMEDIASIYDEIRGIVQDIAKRGDVVNIEGHHRIYGKKVKPEDFKIKRV